jgi:outer membrane lipoprotein-sorting protein
MMSGKMEAGGNRRASLPVPNPHDPHTVPTRPIEQVQLPFVMELKRPRKARVELQYKGQTAVQVFDGTNGWKLRPFLNRVDVEPYTAEELRTASLQSELDGPLVGYAGKGTKVELAGMEKVDGNDTYKLRLATKEGHVFHVWIDAKTFLEAKIEGAPRRLDGRYHPVEIYYRDYRTVGSLKVPYLLETKVLSAPGVNGAKRTDVAVEKIAVEKVEINPKLNDSLFTRAQLDIAASGRPLKTVAAK